MSRDSLTWQNWSSETHLEMQCSCFKIWGAAIVHKGRINPNFLSFRPLVESHKPRKMSVTGCPGIYQLILPFMRWNHRARKTFSPLEVWENSRASSTLDQAGLSLNAVTLILNNSENWFLTDVLASKLDSFQAEMGRRALNSTTRDGCARLSLV